MNKHKTIISVIILLLLLFLGYTYQKQAGTDKTPEEDNSSKIKVTASFYPLYYFAASIGGERASVYDITPPGIEPHDYEPTPQDIARIESSRLLILNGLGLEAWSDSLKQSLSADNTDVIIAGESLSAPMLGGTGNSMKDPHVWLSPILAEEMAGRIAAGFAKIDPANTGYYEQNLSVLKAKLEKLDKNYRSGLGDCSRHDIITSHAAFGYLAKAYGLNEVSIAGLSPDAEPSAKQLADIAKFAKEKNVKFIFFETLVSPKLAQTIADEVGAQPLVLNPLEGLSSEDESRGKNYFTEMENNLANLRIALECK